MQWRWISRVSNSDWVSIGIIREAIRRLNRGYTALPDDVRKGWWRRLWLGLALVLGLTVAVVWGGKVLEGCGMLEWERGAVEWVVAALPISFSTAMWLEGVGNGFVLWGLMLFSAGMAAWARRPLRCLAFLMGYSLVYVVIAAGWWMWDRPRPDLVMQGLASPGGFFRAYPSGHVVQSTFAYGLLTWQWIREATRTSERLTAAILCVLLIAVVALGRLRLGVHWPSDLLAGAVIGGGWVAAVAISTGWAESMLQGRA